MEIPRINSCCCGCSLKNGVLIWLWMFTIVSALMLFYEGSYVISGSKTDALHWFHIFQFCSFIGCFVVNFGCTYAIYWEKPTLLVSFFWFSLSFILPLIIILILLPIFWSDVINSNIATQYFQELLFMKEHHSNDTNYEKIRELIRNFALPVIETVGIIVVLLDSYVTLAAYSLYMDMKDLIAATAEGNIATIEGTKMNTNIIANPAMNVKRTLSLN